MAVDETCEDAMLEIGVYSIRLWLDWIPEQGVKRSLIEMSAVTTRILGQAQSCP